MRKVSLKSSNNNMPDLWSVSHKSHKWDVQVADCRRLICRHYCAHGEQLVLGRYLQLACCSHVLAVVSQALTPSSLCSAWALLCRSSLSLPSLSCGIVFLAPPPPKRIPHQTCPWSTGRVLDSASRFQQFPDLPASNAIPCSGLRSCCGQKVRPILPKLVSSKSRIPVSPFCSTF